MSTVQQMAARMSRQAAESLAASVQAMPADKQVWQPLEGGRSALSQLQECAVMNPWFAQMLRDRVVPPFDGEAYGRMCAEIDTVEKALQALGRSAETLAAAIESVPDARLADSLSLPWGTCTIEDVLFMAYWNMVYHLGQANYIQTLYGDQEMHMGGG